MTSRVWVNPRQPQTLYIAQILLYIQGGIALFFGLPGLVGRVELFGSGLLGSVVVLLMSVGFVAAAFGIANERRWGYRLATAAALSPFLLRLEGLASDGIGGLLSNPITLVFDVALVALILHPVSSSYQKIWFS